jgi:16S rRNA (uracil1498-N3)-methyltransferase
VSAMLQSRSAWIPDLFPECTPERALAAAPTDGIRLVLDATGVPVPSLTMAPPVTLAIGPEGGFEEDELTLLESGGFHRCTLGPSVLRFETAAVAAAAVARSLLIAIPAV